MSSPPGKPKAKKGFRSYVKGRLHKSSQSPSQAAQKAGTGSQSTLSAMYEDPGSMSRASLAPSSDEVPPSGDLTSAGLTVLPPETTATPIVTGPEMGSSAEIPIIQAGKSVSAERRTPGAAWAALGTSLRQLKEKSKLFPPLASAVGSLLSCLDGLESLARNRKGFEDLPKELTVLSESLTQHMLASSSMRMSNSISSVVISQGKVGPGSGGKYTGCKRRRRRAVATLSAYTAIISTATNQCKLKYMEDCKRALGGEQNTRLEGLHPSKQAAYDSSLSAEINRRGCAEGTRVAVLAELDEWLYGSTSPVYWMNGMPGTGKTTIACTFSERLEDRKLLAASFFCTRSSADCKNVARIVPTIAYQLARYSIPFQSALCEVLGQDPDLGTRNMAKQFERLLREPLASVKDAIPANLVVVVDALDECEDRHGVERILDLLFRYAKEVPLKFLVTSRPEPEICNKMNLHAQSVVVIHLHDIEKSLTRTDIELYLKQELTSVSPTAAQIERLAQRSGTLFIYAATLTRYVLFGGQLVDAHQRLLSVLSMTSGYESEGSSNTTESGSTSAFMSATGSISTTESTSTKDPTKIDALYITLLEAALEEAQTEGKVEYLTLVLRTVLMAQEPISVGTIAALAGLDDLDQMTFILQSLRFVLHKSEDDGLVSILHASFPDFMFDNERSSQFYCDVTKHSLLMARRCFGVMKEKLRFNICELESSFVPDEKVENLEDRIREKIQPELAYACQYWARHLECAPTSEVLLVAMDEFLSNQLLFWMEVLNLRRQIAGGVGSLIKARLWMNGLPELPEVALLAEDACNFVTGFAAQPIPTPHICVSWLPFYPRSSLVYKLYSKRTRGLLELKGTLMDERGSNIIATWITDSQILSAAYLPDGGRIVVKCAGDISIRNAYDGSILVGPLGDNHGKLAFSADGALIACGSYSPNHTIRLWDTHNGSLIMDSFEGHTDYVTCVVFSPDSTRIVPASADCTVRVWDVSSGGPLLGPLTKHYMIVSCVVFSPNGVYFASGSRDLSVCLWNAHDGSLVRRPLYGYGFRPVSLAFSLDSTRLIAGYSDSIIAVWDTSDGSLLTDRDQFSDHIGAVTSMVISPDGTRVATASSGTHFSDGIVAIWDINDGTLISGPFKPHHKHRQKPCSVSYSPDGSRLLSSVGKVIRVLNVRQDIPLPPSSIPPEFHPLDDITSVALSPNNNLISISKNHGCGIWNTSDGSYHPGPLTGEPLPNPTVSSPISPNGALIAVFSGPDSRCDIQVLSTDDGSIIAGPLKHHGPVTNLCFSVDSTMLVTGTGSVRVWDLQTGEITAGPFWAHGTHISLALSPDGSHLVSYSKDSNALLLKVWGLHRTTLTLDIPINPVDPSLSALDSGDTFVGWSLRDEPMSEAQGD
ncbi:unnamed protein product [Rhizoctonia solani]|uniref:NACHT domain-containing protein n=1 Tax=Rhizoctonia solani TaxID=456999 RepID=A0A8H2X6F2_9AGAM|nr:unnamed protein product [Rhizoctonia solani]